MSDTEQIDGLLELVCLIKRLLAVDDEPQLDRQFIQRMELPLSEATALWQGRQKIALRVFFLLECLLGWLTPDAPNTHVIHPFYDVQEGTTMSLITNIFQTLHECLAGKKLAHTALL